MRVNRVKASTADFEKMYREAAERLAEVEGRLHEAEGDRRVLRDTLVSVRPILTATAAGSLTPVGQQDARNALSNVEFALRFHGDP